jgi:hypothetical protein
MRTVCGTALLQSANGSANVVVAVPTSIVIRLAVNRLLLDAGGAVLVTWKTAIASCKMIDGSMNHHQSSSFRRTLFAIAFAMVFGLEVVRVAAVALVLELATFAGDGIVVPMVERGAAAGRSVSFVGRLNTRERCNESVSALSATLYYLSKGNRS